MKLLVYIFLISLSYVLSDFIEDDAKKIVVKSYPKKVKPGLYQINNSGKYIKPKVIPTKKQLDDKDYTVFPNVHNEKANLPDSPYFQVEKIPENQPRIKKVLPDYITNSRSKRSVVAKKDDDKKKAALKPFGGAKGNETQKPKPKKPIKRTNKNIQRKRLNKKRHGKRARFARLRRGPKNNRKLKNRQRSIKRSQKHAKLRSRYGDKQARQILKDRRNFMNATKNSQKGK